MNTYVHQRYRDAHNLNIPGALPQEAQAVWGYTCPVHLHVRQEKPGKCGTCGMTLEACISPIHLIRPKWSRTVCNGKELNAMIKTT